MKRKYNFTLNNEPMTKKRKINYYDNIKELLNQHQYYFEEINKKLISLETRINNIEKKINDNEIPKFTTPPSYFY